jgi:transposase
MKIFKEYQPQQMLLLPPSLDELVPENHEVRIISEVVEQIDLTSITNKYEGGGCSAYDPEMMMKIIVHAYSQKIYSGRRMSQELKTDTAFMYLSAMQYPDFRTICKFRSDHAAEIPRIFVEVIRLCAQLGLVGLGHIAFDGAKLKASASVKQTRDQEGLEKEMKRIEEEIAKMLETSGQIDQLEDAFYGERDGSELPKELVKREKRLQKISEAKKLLEKEKLEKVNLTDSASRIMQDKKKVKEPCYNGQLAVDDKAGVIVAADVVQDATDHAQLEPMVKAVEKNLVELPREASADAGYSSYDNLEYVDNKDLDLYMPDNFLESLEKQTEEEKRYDKSQFQYDETNDRYLCPEGKELSFYSEVKRGEKEPLKIYRGEGCGDCEVRGKCTKGKVRTVTRDGREELMEAMRQKLKTPEGKKIYQKRMYTVEPVFGNIQGNRGKIMMSLRGKVKVKGEWLLMCLVHNIRKIVREVLASGISLGKMLLLLAKKSCPDRMSLAKI